MGVKDNYTFLKKNKKKIKEWPATQVGPEGGFGYLKLANL
jgi:hypothetical protein